jgi:phage head maturation protease
MTENRINRINKSNGQTSSKVYKNFKTDDVEDVGHNALVFTVSTNEIDRDGDVVHIPGLSTQSYMRNAVFLYGHDYNSLPIGRTTRLHTQQDGDVQKLKARVEFTPDSAYSAGYSGITGQTVRRMYVKNFLNATSIGFTPWETQPLVDKRVGNPGNVYLRSDLLDISAVAVPANAGALMERSADPEYRTMLKSWARETIRMCDGRSCSSASKGSDDDDDVVYRVDEQVLAEELARAVARYDDSEDSEEIFRVDEDDLNAVLNAIRLMGV